MIKLFICPACTGDGQGRYFFQKNGRSCEECNGTGLVSEEEGERILEEWGIDEPLEQKDDIRRLHCILKKKWFDMISEGIKKEEYRELTGHHWIRLVQCGEVAGNDFKNGEMILCKKFDVVEFQHGYRKDARRMILKFETTEIGRGKKEWGAPSYPVFIIKLGEIIHKNF